MRSESLAAASRAKSQHAMHAVHADGEPPLPALTAAAPCSTHSTVMEKTEWERLLSWFMSVAPTLRFFLPTCMGSARRVRARMRGATAHAAWGRVRAATHTPHPRPLPM